MSISTTFTLRFAGAAVSNGIARITGQINRLGGVAANLGKSLVSPFAGLAAVLAPAALGAGFVSLVKDASAAAASVEDLTIQFTVLTGSLDTAKSLMRQFKEEEKKSSLSLDDYAQGSKLLLQFGMSLESIMPTLKMIGDASMGNSERFGRLALAMAQIQSKGKLAGQELLQLAESGFNPLQIMVKTTGKRYEELFKLMEDRKITIRDVTSALQSATSQGGIFYKAIDKGSVSTTAKINQYKAAITSLEVAFGTPFNESLKDVLDKITKQINLFEWKAEQFGKTVGTTMSQLVSAFEQGRLGEVVESALLAGISRFGEEFIALMVYSGNVLYDTISARIKDGSLGKLFSLPGAIGDYKENINAVKPIENYILPESVTKQIPETLSKLLPVNFVLRRVADTRDIIDGFNKNFDQQGGSTKTLAQTRQGFRDAFGSVNYAAQLKNDLITRVPSTPSTAISTQKVDTEQHRLMREMTEQLKGVNEKLSPQP